MKKIFLSFLMIVAFAFVLMSCGLVGSMSGEWTLESIACTNTSNYTTPFVGLFSSGTNTLVLKVEGSEATMILADLDTGSEGEMAERGTLTVEDTVITFTPYAGGVMKAKCVIENDTMTWSEFDGLDYTIGLFAYETYSSWVWKKK